MRKIVNYSFLDHALQNQEPRIQGHVQTLIQDLDCERSKNGIVDMTGWYSCAGFDIVADAAFREPFNTLQKPTLPLVIIPHKNDVESHNLRKRIEEHSTSAVYLSSLDPHQTR